MFSEAAEEKLSLLKQWATNTRIKFAPVMWFIMRNERMRNIISHHSLAENILTELHRFKIVLIESGVKEADIPLPGGW